MEDLTGKALGRYQLSSLVGRGGKATMYKAVDPGLNRTVAIKLLHPHLSADPAFVARFRREAQAVAQLRHPNIVRVFDFDSADGAYFMVMEYVDGPTLATYLKRLSRKGQTPAAADILRIFPPLCSAIDYANREGMVHRDIKPTNIILTRKGEPVITDYGIARIAGATSYTLPGTVVGSAQYMSPEQAQGLLADNRSDIYSLGICLFEALTGRVPFDGETTATILAQHLTAPVPAARALNPDLSPRMEEILTKVLAKDPAARYQEAGELARDLEETLRPAAAPGGATLVEQAVAPLAAATRIEQQAATPPPPPEPPASPPNEPAVGPAPPGAAPLSPWQAQPPGAPPMPVPPAPVTGTAAPKRRRFPLLLIALAAVVVVSGGVAAGLLLTGYGGTSSTTSRVVVSTTVTGGAASPSSTGTSGTTSTTTAEQAALLAEGDQLLRQGKHQEAAAKYQEILQTDPNSSAAHTQLGVAYYMLPNKNDLARPELESAVQLDPTNSKAWGFLGETLNELAYDGKIEGYALAEEDLRKAIALDPTNSAARGFLGELMTNNQREDLGLAQAQRAVSEAPGDYFAQSSLGYVYGQRGEWQQAIAPYRKALALEPNWPVLKLLLAEALRETGQYDEAVSLGQQVLNMDEGFEEHGYRSIALTLSAKGDVQGAVSNFEKAISLNSTDDFAEWGLGSLYYNQDQYDKALPHLQRAVALSPNDAGYHAWLGGCYDALGQYTEARADLELALKLDPTRSDAKKILADMTAAGH